MATEIAGPYAGKILVDAGAEVTRLEPPGGDPLRRFTASLTPLEAGRDGALFQFLNAGKRSAVADPDTREGRDLARSLATRADLVIEDFGPGVLRDRGLSFDALRERNRGVSLVSISPFGSTGPWAQRPATEFTLQAQAGSTAYRGLPERGPVAAGGRLGEWCAGTYAAVGALAAYLSARRTGDGQHVDVSTFEAILSCLTIYHDLQGRFFGGDLAQSIETPSIEPARDGWVGLCTYTGQQWKDFCSLIGRPDIGEDERFYDSRQRMEHLGLVQEAMHAWTREHDVDEIIELCSLLRIPVAPIGNGETVLQMDQFTERRVFVDHPGGFKQPRVPYSISGVARRPIARAPALDEHGDAVRAEAASAAPTIREPRGGSARPLDGVRVIDLTAFWAGPVATAALSDLGADVVKVESTQRPDGMRFVGAVRNGTFWEWSPVFHGANPGKRDVTLRLDSPEGMALFERLLESADVLVDNYSARVMDHFGLTWERVHAINPALVMARMPAWGLDGPWRERTGFAPSVEQASGLAWLTGYDDMPLIVRGACDPLGGMHAVVAILLALEARREDGEGRFVEVPLVEPALNVAAAQVAEFTAYGTLLSRSGNRAPEAAPQGVYGCRGEPARIAIAVKEDAHWQGLRRALGDPEWMRDPALASAAGRRAAHDAIDERLQSWCASLEAGAAVERLICEGVPAAPLINAFRIHPNPQLEHRGYYQTLEHRHTGPTRYPGPPMRFSGIDPREHRTPPPALGQHNDEILGDELGLSREALDALREKGIIGERPAFETS
jgi:crotonobetainyl-CoA:carnitine CoA-transferase CaiB-like acyl-CoA transferase